ncbi:hypothetical protein WMO21_14390 [Lachnospiraceae bacterium CLA-AA-H58]|uniref:hypothetical protein n=1 Tax=Pilosibacter fragilis TaxID=3078042 RepID=UPI0032D3E5A8
MIKVIGIGDNVCDQYYPAKIMYPGGQAMNFSVYAKMLGAQSAYLGVFGKDRVAEHFLMRSGSIIPDAGNMPARMDTQKSGLKMVTDSLS